MGKLLIERKAQDKAMNYGMSVRIDDGNKISLMPGESTQVELADGVHKLVVALNLQKKTLNVELPLENRIVVAFETGVVIESPNKPVAQMETKTSNVDNVPKIKKETKIVEEPIINTQRVGNDGIAQNYTETSDGEWQRVEVICPYCGSNQVIKVNDVSVGQLIVFGVLFAIPAIVISHPLAHKVFGFISIASFVLALLLIVIRAFSKKKTTWNIHCETCNKNFDFPIPSPDSKQIITNLKSTK